MLNTFSPLRRREHNRNHSPRRGKSSFIAEESQALAYRFENLGFVKGDEGREGRDDGEHEDENERETGVVRRRWVGTPGLNDEFRGLRIASPSVLITGSIDGQITCPEQRERSENFPLEQTVLPSLRVDFDIPTDTRISQVLSLGARITRIIRDMSTMFITTTRQFLSWETAPAPPEQRRNTLLDMYQKVINRINNFHRQTTQRERIILCLTAIFLLTSVGLTLAFGIAYTVQTGRLNNLSNRNIPITKTEINYNKGAWQSSTVTPTRILGVRSMKTTYPPTTITHSRIVEKGKTEKWTVVCTRSPGGVSECHGMGSPEVSQPLLEGEPGGGVEEGGSYEWARNIIEEWDKAGEAVKATNAEKKRDEPESVVEMEREVRGRRVMWI